MKAEIWLWINAEEVEEAERIGFGEVEKKFGWSPCYIDETDIKVVWFSNSKNIVVTLSSGENYTLKPTEETIKTLKLEQEKYPL